MNTFISSTQNLLSALKKLPSLTSKYYGSGLQIKISDMDDEDILAVEVCGEDFKEIGEAISSSIKKRLSLRLNLLNSEIKSIKELGLEDYSTSPLETMLDLLYEKPEDYPKVLKTLNLEVESAKDFAKANIHDYREYLNDEIRKELSTKRMPFKLYKKYILDTVQ